MLNIEQFILEVEQRLPLYNVTIQEYSNRQIKAKCWLEVCEVMYENWFELLPEQKDQKGKIF